MAGPAGITRRGAVSFPGLTGYYAASYTNSYGVEPGSIYVSASPVGIGDVAAYGDVVFTDGIDSVRLQGCRLVDCWVTGDPSGPLSVTLHLEDRRWMWRYAAVNGHYNKTAFRTVEYQKVPDKDTQQIGNVPQEDRILYPDGYVPQIEEWTRKSTRQLAEILCKAMGEMSYEVSCFPTNQYPEVNWDGANPARELQNLAEAFGFRVMIRHDSNGVFVTPLGYGKLMPPCAPGDQGEDVVGIDPPEGPMLFTVYGAEALYQLSMTTGPVGEDFDGRLKPISKLSYCPGKDPDNLADDWRRYGPPFDQLRCTGKNDNLMGIIWPKGLPGKRNGYDAAQLADHWVYRAYRIRTTIPCPLPFGHFENNLDEAFYIPPNSTKPENKRDRHDIILTNYTVEIAQDDIGIRNVLPARAYGRTDAGFRVGGGINFQATQFGDVIHVPFEVDARRQFVIFAHPIYFRKILLDKNAAVINGNDGKPMMGFFPTNPIIETAVMLRDKDTHQIVRYKKSFPRAKRDSNPRPGAVNRSQPFEYPVFREEIRYTEHYKHDGDVLIRKNIWDVQIDRVTDNQKEADKKAEYAVVPEMLRWQLTVPQRREYLKIEPLDLDGAIQQVTYTFDPKSVRTIISRHTEHSYMLHLDPYLLRRQQEETDLGEVKKLKDKIDDIRRRIRLAGPAGALAKE